MERLVFQTMPTVILGGRTLQDVPVILQYEDTPLVEIITQSSLVYTTRIPIYAPDGAKLAKVIGTTIYPTEEGSAKGIEAESSPNRWT